MRAFEFLYLLTKLSVKSNVKFRNLKFTKLSLLIKPIEKPKKNFPKYQKRFKMLKVDIFRKKNDENLENFLRL